MENFATETFQEPEEAEAGDDTESPPSDDRGQEPTEQTETDRSPQVRILKWQANELILKYHELKLNVPLIFAIVIPL